MRLFDSHCHLDYPEFDRDRAEVWARARSAGVLGALLAGVEPAQWGRAAAMRGELEGAVIAVGLHPVALGALGEAGLDEALGALEEATRTLGPVALGETGLDRRVARDPAGASRALQERAFRAQLRLARRAGLPLVLHVVGEHGRALEVLADEGPLPGGVVHAYSGPAELVPRYLALGLALGFGGAAARPEARKVHRAVRAVPAGRLLLETDAPDLPLPGGPSRNEPAAVAAVAETVALLRGEPAAEVADRATEAARALYGLV